MSVNHIGEEEFTKEVLEAKEPVFVDFYADWCGPCRMLSPIMEEISETHKVYKINTDEAMNLAREYGIMSIPTLLIFNDGKLINTSVGLKSKEEINDLIK